MIGPGHKNDEFITIGEYSHIFSAVENGPRTDGGLSLKELGRPENGIYLCRVHHQIVDTKSQENKYTSDLLTLYKNRHEFHISGELGEYLYPLNFINKFKIEGTFFDKELTLNLGKVTFIYGSNGTGKSTIIEIFHSIFTQNIHPRWNKPDVHFNVEIGLDNPTLSDFKIITRGQELTYIIKENEQPFVPFPFEVFKLNTDVKTKKDDVSYVTEILGITRDNFLKTASLEHGLLVNEISIRNIRATPYLVDKIDVTFKDDFKRSFGSLSGTEKSRVILDILICYVTELSKYKSVLLLLDWSKAVSFTDGSLKPYLEFLQSSTAHFQTLFVSHRERPDLDWTGWVIAKLSRENGTTTVSQTER